MTVKVKNEKGTAVGRGHMGFLSLFGGQRQAQQAAQHQEAVKLAQAYRWIWFGMDRKSVEREAAKDPTMKPCHMGDEIYGYDTTFANLPFTVSFEYHQERLYAIDFGYYGQDPYDVREMLYKMMTEKYGQPYAVTMDVTAWKTEDRLVKLMVWRKKMFITHVRLYIEYTPMTDLIEQEKAERIERLAKSELANFG
jgi:hypothetical protein